MAAPRNRQSLVSHNSLANLQSHMPPQIALPARNTLQDLTLTKQLPEPVFQATILGYGVQLVAHAVLLHKVAELRAGKTTTEALLQSVQGETRPACTFPEGKQIIGSLRAMSNSFYVPPCAFQNSQTFKAETDKAIVFFSVDLANLFFQPGSGLNKAPSFDGMETFTRGVNTLTDMQRQKTFDKGLRLVKQGYSTVVTNYVKELTDAGQSGPLGAVSLIRHYEDLIRFYADRTKALLTSS